MAKAKKLYILLGVLLAVCGAAFAVSRREARKEQIQASGEVVLSIPADSVTALSWTNSGGSFAFTRDSEGWHYTEDANFPPDSEKIGKLLEDFEHFSAAFVIDDVEDYGQYGLEKPRCTITVTTGEGSYTITLGDESKMDSQRYVSLGDGKAYLAVHDPMEEYGAVLSDMILNDTLPELDTVEEIRFSGTENYTIIREENGESLCDTDVYFTEGKPLDTTAVEEYLYAVEHLKLETYASYAALDTLAEYGLDAPALTAQISYRSGEDTGKLQLEIAPDPQEAAAYAEALEKGTELPAVTYYARVGASPIVYTITSGEYASLTAVAYDELRHQKLFTGDFDAVTGMEITLGGERYSLARRIPEGGQEETWCYGDTPVDSTTFRSALTALTATGFTGENPAGQEEISLTLYLNGESTPGFTLTLYRYDGTACLACVDGSPVAFVSRAQTVSLTEAVNAWILG